MCNDRIAVGYGVQHRRSNREELISREKKVTHRSMRRRAGTGHPRVTAACILMDLVVVFVFVDDVSVRED